MPTQPTREEELFHEALELPSGPQRSTFLEKACAGDEALRQRIEALLLADAQAGTTLDPVVARAVVEPGVTEKPGDRIGRYKLLQVIGEGGFGIVYMAEQHEPVRRRVALKVIKLGMDTKQVIARFEAERQALALMDHPNIAKVLDAGATDTGRPFFVMELVRGVPITEYCDQNNLSTHPRLDLFIPVCKAVQHAHQKGVIHRDIKPSNILVTLHDGVPVPKVIDFGIAKAIDQPLTEKTLFTRFEQFMGTPAYMSPEQAEMSGLDIDTRSDIYSLGVLLYELLTGKTPFDPKHLLEASLDEIRRIIREDEPPRPSARISTLVASEQTTVARCRGSEPPRLIHMVRGDLDWIVMKAMEKDRARRYETANGLATDITRFLANEPIAARPPSSLYKLQKLARRNKLTFIAVSAVSAALIMGLGVSTWMFFKEQQARQQAEAERNTAETEAAKSLQVAQFLEDMLQGVGPSVAMSRDTTMLREILDKTAERVGKDLKNQPLVQAELQSIIGETYGALGEYRKAEALLRESLTTGRTLLGNDHPAVAHSLFSLGWVLLDEWKLDEAEGAAREALAIRKKLYTQPHRELADSLNELGLVLRREAKLDEAEDMLRQSLMMRKQLLGDENPDVLDSLNILSGLLYLRNRLDEAESMMREELALARRLYGNEHPSVASALITLGPVLESEGKLAEAEQVIRDGVAMKRRLYGNGNATLLISLGYLGDLLVREGRFAEAEPVFREALAIGRKGFGNDHIRVCVPLEGLAAALQGCGELVEGEALLCESLAIREKQQPENWETFRCKSLLGSNLLVQRRYIEAEPLLISGYEGIKQQEQRIPFRRRESLRKALARLVQLYEATDRPDQAAEWKQKLADFDKIEAEKKVSDSQGQSATASKESP
jgi:serine/threonine protein kinase